MMDFSKYRALTFDCYGTLIDWETGMVNVVRPWLNDMKSSVTPELFLTAYAFMKWRHEQPRPAILFTELMCRCWQDLESTFGFPHHPERAESFAASIGEWPPFSDSVANLNYLSKHYKLAILSNIDNASIELSEKRLVAPFAVTVTAEDVGSYKPDHAHFAEAFRRLEALGIRRHEILHVAQSRYHDIAPANALGLDSVWVNRRRGKPGTGATIVSEAKATLSVDSLTELAQLHRQSLATA
jgi:2-haloacid dehalogenase